MHFSRWTAVLSCAFTLFAETLPVPRGLDTYVPSPTFNPLRPESVKAGRALFFYKGLSRDGSLSCANCHLPERAFTDGRSTAVGVRGQKGPRRTPPILNRAWGKTFFWDGRVGTLEEQVLQPIINPLEMDLPLSDIGPRVDRDGELAATMRRAFGRAPEVQDVANALASYVRSILSGDSAYDAYLAGDRNALSEEQRLGLTLFRGKANCVTCHLGPNLTDEQFHNTGVGLGEGEQIDVGRMSISGRAEDRGSFKTPGLRQVAETAPYMHNGSLRTLEDVVEYYNKGGHPNSNLDAEIQELHLTIGEKRALTAFLQSLSGKVSEGWPGLH